METSQTDAEEQVRNFNAFMLMFEDGAFHAQVSEALRDLNADMNNHVMHYGTKPTAELTLKFKFKLEDGVFTIVPDYSVKAPKAPHGKAVAWSTPSNNFCPHNPKQANLFGVRDVTGGGEVRSV